MIQSIIKSFCTFLFLGLPFTNTLHAQTVVSFAASRPNTNPSLLSLTLKNSSSELSLTAQVIQNANCNQKGIILAQAKDGTAPYEYQIVKSIPSGNTPIPPPPPTLSGIWAVSNTFNVDEGTYLVMVRDKLGMEVSTLVTVAKDSIPKTQLNLKNKCVSEGNFEIQIASIIPGIPPYFLSMNGSVFEAVNLPHTLSNQNSGDYNFIIKDSNGCENRQTISIEAPLELSIKSITQPSCQSNDGTITLVTKGGASNFVYTLNEGLPTANPMFTHLSPGAHTFRVDDKTTGCFDESEVNLSSATAVTGLKLLSTPVICHGGNDGTITAIIDPPAIGVNDNPMYQYSIDSLHFQESNVFSGLVAGSYTVEVISGRGCVAIDTIIVTEPTSISVSSPIVSPFSCSSNNNLNDASISIGETTGGSGAYEQFEFVKNSRSVQFGTSPTYVESDLSGGNYSITVYDANGCSGRSSEVTIIPFVSVDKIKITTTTTISCTSHESIQVSVETKGGPPKNVAYSLVDINLETGIRGAIYSLQTNSTGIFTGLSAGEYSVTLLNKDTGCSLQEIYHVKEPNTFDLKIDSIKAVSCYAGNDGGAQFIFMDRNSPDRSEALSYEIRNQSDIIVLQNSASGFGHIPISGLTAGTYTLKATLTNAPFCSVIKSFSISEPVSLAATLTLKAPLHCGVEPIVTLAVSGGVPPYTYSKDGNVYTSSMFETTQHIAVGIGTHNYYVKDAKGCLNQSNIIVIDSIPGLIVDVDETLATINCKGDASAVLIASASGGLGSYRYSLLDAMDATIRPFQSSGTFTHLAVGKYKIKVESADCNPAESKLITISEPEEKLSAIFSVVDVLCPGANNGKIQIDVTGGKAKVKVAITPNLSQFTETSFFDNLTPGNYEVMVQDALGCYVKKTLSIKEPAPLEAKTISSSFDQGLCFYDKTNQFSIAISGGTLPYSVALDKPAGPFETGTPTQTQFDFTNLNAGLHTVYVQDINKCTTDLIIQVNEAIKLNPTISVNYDCVNNTQYSSTTINVDSSIIDFSLLQFALDGGFYQSSNVFKDLPPGDHFVRVKHKNGCIKDTSVFTIKKVDPLTLSLKEGGLNEIIAVANGGGGNYKFTFEGQFNGANPSYLYYKTQDYLVTVQDANGCSTSLTQKFNFIDICTPNYFTPNGDGINDTWAPACTVNYKNLSFTVHDRYGRELGTYKLGASWDGKYQEKELPSGDYWYVLKLNNSKDDREFVGHFTLYR